MLWLQCRGDSCKGLSTKALGNSVSGTYMSPKDLAKLLVSLCSFFFFQGEQVLQDKYSTRLLVDPNENLIHTKRKRRLLSSTVPSLG